MTREIPLTRGKIAIVDDADYDRVMTKKWHAQRVRHHWYARWGTDVNYEAVYIYLHHFILGTPNNELIDHADGDGLNCTRANMRPATYQQNNWNARRSCTNTTGFKGVHRWRGKFSAGLLVDGKDTRLGAFDSAEFAARVVDCAARHFRGEFAWTNFPDVDAAALNHFDRWLAGFRGRKSNAKLTASQVAEIRERWARGGVLQKDLAADYGVKTVTINHIVCLRTWKDLDAALLHERMALR